MAEELRRPVQVDTKLGELHERLAKVRAGMDSTKLSLASQVGIRPEYATRTRREVRETTAELLTLAAERLEGGKLLAWARNDLERTVARWHEAVAECTAIRAEMKPLDDEFEANPWSRFFLVTSSAGGHIHSSTACSTTRIRTGFAWLPTLSGLTEKDAVEAHGPLLCTVCYPSAPVEWTVGPKVKS